RHSETSRPKGRHHVLRENPFGQGPGRVEDEEAERVAKARGLTPLFPDLAARGPLPLGARHEIRLESRDVDNDEAIGEVMKQPSRTLEIHAELIQTVLDRYVEGGEGAGSHGAVVREEMTSLKRANGNFQRGIEHARRVVPGRGAQIAARAESGSQGRNPFIAVPRLERGVPWNPGPSTSSREISIERKLPAKVTVVGMSWAQTLEKWRDLS